MWLIIIAVVAAAYFSVPVQSQSIKIPGTPWTVDVMSLANRFPLKLGLDLQGGTQLILQADMSAISADQRDNALESAKEVIERRVNLFGVSEAVVQTSKLGEERRILVELPGIKDASSAAELVGKTAQLDFRELQASPAADLGGTEATDSGAVVGGFVSTGLTGADLRSAQVSFSGQGSAGPEVSISFNEKGAQKFAEITRRNLGQPLAIYLDDQLVTAPTVQQEIIGGSAVINGQFTTDEAKQLAVQLNAGALPVPIKLLTQQSISANLGQESVARSLVAAIVGLITVMIYMALYYGKLGLVANLALLIYTLITIAIFRTGLLLIPPVTLTLAGIAGFILSIGMAVDANILIFERMKEERHWGKTAKQSLDLGFSRAWSSIRDSNSSSLITAAILYFLGTGSVRGFAVTLALGVLVSMFTAITITRTMLKLVIK